MKRYLGVRISWECISLYDKNTTELYNRYLLLIYILMPSRYITEKDNRRKKKHIVRTPCAHYGKEMAMEDDNVYLEVNPL